MQNITDIRIQRIINTLVSAKGSDSIGIMAIGKVLVVYDGLNPVHRYTCSNSREASKTADRIQEAYDSGYFQKHQARMM